MSIASPRSFPRNRESSLCDFWVPAFAGTGGGKADTLAQHRLGPADFGRAWQERQDGTSLRAQRLRNHVGDLPFDRRVRIPADVPRLDREGAPEAFDHRCIAEKPGHACAVDGRRHHQQLEILAQAGLHVSRERQSEVGIERTLVEFVEQERRDAVERCVVEYHAGENAFGDDFYAGPARDLGAEAHAVADRLPDGFSERRRHARCRRTRRQAARLEHDDLLPCRPRLGSEHQRHTRRLACAGGRHEHGDIAAAKRGGQRRQRIVDRKRSVEIHQG